MTGRIFHDRHALKRFAEERRREGAIIVFTNGVFDLLHPGHLDSLRRARAEGDILIVGINSDESVQRLKGPGRPILPTLQRLRVIAALQPVSAVIPFDEDTPAGLVEFLQPDVLVKGGHYQIHEIAGHEVVLARGGRVLSLPLVEGQSTSGIVDTIKNRFAR